ncbi:unnamed protein product [Lactuca virosa]|uniref:Plant basic secretory protein (BSP) family protein n=1 Tax=Lactuca virosa TaxID=75947 RepID=A0AAU9P419_9ASTR|nr:unnamed protein product [Lactuca virosa]
MSHRYFFLCSLLAYSLSLHGISAVDYQVTNYDPNTPGGIRFTNEIGVPYTKQIMGTINDFIWTTVFQQNNPSDRKPVDSVNLYITEIEGYEGITWGNNNINLSSSFLEGYQGDVKWGFTSLLYHEMTHVFQYNGEGDGDKWDQGYDFTARFLEYCDGIVPEFVAKLNAMMKFAFDVKYFEDLTGKPVDQLWQEYKAKYGH